MFSFEILNQDGEAVATTRYGDFTVAVLQLGTAPNDFYVIQLATGGAPHSKAVAIYSSFEQASRLVNSLQKFARNLRFEGESFMFADDEEGVSVLAIVALLDGRPNACIDTGRTPADEAQTVRRTIHSY
jgi:hypothetical protein